LADLRPSPFAVLAND
jgi:chromosome segregation ATPase